jgi:hypothetical protein
VLGGQVALDQGRLSDRIVVLVLKEQADGDSQGPPRTDHAVLLADHGGRGGVGDRSGTGIGATADFSVGLTGPQSTRLGEPLTFQVTVTNNGPGRRTGGVVEERRPWVVLHGPRRPDWLEHLVGRAPEQDASAAFRDRADASSIWGVKP